MADTGVYFSDRPTEFEIRDGLVFIRTQSGAIRMERCTTINAFEREVQFCRRMLDDWYKSQADKIVRFEGDNG